MILMEIAVMMFIMMKMAQKNQETKYGEENMSNTTQRFMFKILTYQILKNHPQVFFLSLHN